MLRTWGVRSYRVLCLGVAAVLIGAAYQHEQQSALGPAVRLDEARRIFPTAARLGPRDLERDGHPVLATDGRVLGFVLRTAPQTDDVIGYAGPSDLLVGLSPEGRIVQVQLLSSGDTPAHVDAVRKAREFWDQFADRDPQASGLRDIAGVSGSTLTSLAMGEALQRRLSGAANSLRFPEAVGLDEVQTFYPDAASLQPDVPLPGWHRALDARGAVLGYVVRTSPASDDLIGYKGPTESLFAVAADQQTIQAVRLRSSYDTPDYVERVREDDSFFERFVGLRLADLPEIDFVAQGIEGVSGATQTSFAVAEGLRRRAVRDEQLRDAATATRAWVSPRDVGLGAIIAGALVLAFTSWKGARLVRSLWQIVLMVGFGLWFGDMLSISLLAGWARHGIPWTTATLLVLLASVSLAIPWGTKRQIYCHHLCPHGAAQEWLGRFRRWHVRVPTRLSRLLGFLPGGLLILAFGLAVADSEFDLASLEPFDGWVLKTGAAVSLTVAVASLVVSAFIPQAYCRYGCPTGALLKFIRSHGRNESFGVSEALATGVLLVVALWLWVPRWTSERLATTASLPAADSKTRLTGEAFGTTWSVTLREAVPDASALRDQIAAELERIEARLSHWRTESETAQFNASGTTFELEYSAGLIDQVHFAMELSRATEGAYDITVGPLVDAWGYGPSGPSDATPSDTEIAALLERVGFDKLHVDVEFSSLRKDHPDLMIDLGSLLQGHATDRVAGLLSNAGVEEFLIDVGGELRARGGWSVAIEHPVTPERPLRTLTLEDSALATSGVYRPSWDGRGSQRHVISPKTGRPITTTTILCAVVAQSGRDADAWATALLSLPLDEALALAERQQLSALFVDADGQVVTTARMAARGE